MRFPVSFAACALLIGLAGPAVSGGSEARPDRKQAPEPALAEVDGQPITSNDVAKALGAPLARLEEQLYTMKRQKLDALIDERLLATEASRRGVTVDALLQGEVKGKVPALSDDDLDAYVASNKAQFGADDDPETMREVARVRLRAQREKALRETLLGSLRERAHVSIHLVAPEPYRVAMPTEGARVRGRADAAVTVVEFSDFHCPFCRRVQESLDQVRAKYGDKLRLVYRDFPLDRLHPQARKAAEAARCAGDQGKFWEFHDLLYKNTPDASTDTLKRLAGESGLDVSAFEACVGAGTHAAEVRTDEQAGQKAGVTGTPAFFVNGRPLAGAQPLEGFSRLIDEELARGAPAAAPKTTVKR